MKNNNYHQSNHKNNKKKRKIKKDFLIKVGIFVLLVLVLATVGVLSDIYLRDPQTDDTSPLSTVDNAQITYIEKGTPVIEEIYYRKSHYLSRQTVTGDSRFAEKSFSELRGEGWDISWSKDGNIIAFMELDELCPEDAVKRHLGVYGGEVAVFAGPSGADGEILEILGIRLEDLYPDWQEKLANGGMDFENNEELLNALESLDEF